MGETGESEERRSRNQDSRDQEAGEIMTHVQTGNRDIGNRAQCALPVNPLIPFIRISKIAQNTVGFYPLALHDNLKSRKMVETILADRLEKANQ